MEQLHQPIGLFDSGLGGISVLAEALRYLPTEDYIYYGDNLHVPYGDKKPEEVLALTRLAVDKLVEMGCKAVVLACNTATSAAAERLRQELALPIIGMEPALKPATLLLGEGDILVMATQMTLTQRKFQSLMEQYGKNAVPVPCPGLMECVEAGELSGDWVMDRISSLLSPYLKRPIKAVVLGCTHYVFLRRIISALLGPMVPLVDGNHGTVQQLERVLKMRDLLRPSKAVRGSATFVTSAIRQEDQLDRMQIMLQLALELTADEEQAALNTTGTENSQY